MSQPQKPKTILLIDVSRAIRQVGEIWHIDKGEVGTTFRASIHGKNVRVLMPDFGKKLTDAPFEKGSPGHVVLSIPALESWLRSFTEADDLPFGPARREP